MEREKETEPYLCEQVKQLGGRADKFISPGCAGVPDRIVILPGGHVFFVETKSEGRTSTALQRKIQRELRKLGCTVYSDIDTKQKVKEVLQHELADGVRFSAAPVSELLHQQDT